MDLSNINWTEVAGAIALGMLTLERVGKLIPNSAGGLLGMIRALSKIGGLYVQNRQNNSDKLN